MKSFFALLLIASVAIAVQAAPAMTDEQKEKVKTYASECVESTGVDTSLIGKARKQEYTGRDPKLAKYYCCLMDKMSFQKADGSFDADLMVEKMPGNADHESASKAVKKCAVHDAALGHDENAMNFVYCFYKHVGKEFKLY